MQHFQTRKPNHLDRAQIGPVWNSVQIYAGMIMWWDNQQWMDQPRKHLVNKTREGETWWGSNMPDQATDHRNIRSSCLTGENKETVFLVSPSSQQDVAYLFQCQLLWDGFILHFLDFLHELVDLKLLLLLQMLLQLRLLMLELQWSAKDGGQTESG